MIVPSQLSLARRLRSMSGSKLAELAGVSAGRISQLERGSGKPAPEALVNQLSLVLSVPVGFLVEGPAEVEKEQPAVTFHYRHLARTPASMRHSVEAKAKLMAQFTERLREYFVDLPVPQVLKRPRPVVSHTEALVHAECVANEVREAWGLGVGPIPNLVSLLEAQGLWVHELDAKTTMIDAFSYWSEDGQAHIVLNPTKGDAFRSRMDAAHELAHLTMHDGLVTGSRELESEAFRFGGAFLMPAKSWKYEVPRSTVWRDYLDVSKRWRVSIAAAIRRNYDLGLLDENEYRSAMVRYSMDDVKHREVELRGLVPAERPTRMAAYLTALARHGISLDDLAGALHLPSDVARDLAGLPEPPPSGRGQVVPFPTWRQIGER